MDGFPVVIEVEPRFRDTDAMGHVNNAVFFTYLETARVDYMRNVVWKFTSRNLLEAGLILAEISCQFKVPIFYGQSVEVGTRVVEMRNSSFLIDHRIDADGQLAALGQGVVVHYDYQAGKSVRIPDDIRARVEVFEAKGEVS